MKSKNSFFFPILFMMGITFFCILALAFLNEGTKETIERQAQLEKQKHILYVFHLGESLDEKQQEDLFQENVEEHTENGRTYFIGKKDGQVLGYAFFISGKGLWGEIEGYLAMDESYSKILGITFTKHSETPGLGGRIDELWYKEQFRELNIKESPLIYKPKPNGTVDAISGATQTSDLVLKLIQQNITEITTEMGGIN